MKRVLFRDVPINTRFKNFECDNHHYKKYSTRYANCFVDGVEWDDHFSEYEYVYINEVVE